MSVDIELFKAHGAAGLVSAKRGKPSPRRLPQETRCEALELSRSHSGDFGPTLAHEKLTEKHGLKLCVETLRGWMIEDGAWLPRARRARRSYPPRERRACRGELVQIDGCEHAWFEDRGPAYDAHRPVQEHERPEESFTLQDDRGVSESLTINHKRILYVIEDTEENRRLRRHRVTVHEHADGTITIHHGSRVLAHHAHPKDTARITQERSWGTNAWQTPWSGSPSNSASAIGTGW